MRRQRNVVINTKDVSAILIGDIHFRADQPICRLDDDFLETQIRKAKWFKQLWVDCNMPPVFHPGEVFERWNSTPQIISAVLEHFPPMITTLSNPGRHQNLSEWEKDALYTISLSDTGWIILPDTETCFETNDAMVFACPYLGECKPEPGRGTNKKKVLITHKMILGSPAPFEGYNGEAFLEKMMGYDLIVAGHSHIPVEAQIMNRKLINPGSFTRQSAAEEHFPRVYLWRALTNEIDKVYVPIDESALSREHIEVKVQEDERMVAFVQLLDKSQKTEITIKFRDNVKAFLAANKKLLRAGIEDRILEAVDEK